MTFRSQCTPKCLPIWSGTFRVGNSSENIFMHYLFPECYTHMKIYSCIIYFLSIIHTVYTEVFIWRRPPDVHQLKNVDVHQLKIWRRPPVKKRRINFWAKLPTPHETSSTSRRWRASITSQNRSSANIHVSWSKFWRRKRQGQCQRVLCQMISVRHGLACSTEEVWLPNLV